MEALGRQICAEMYDCASDALDDEVRIEKVMLDAARDCGATVVNQMLHHFSPHGVSGVVIIAESHIAIHTWPEYNYAAVDVFTCGKEVDPQRAIDSLAMSLKVGRLEVMDLKRGQIKLPGKEVLKHKPIITNPA